MSTNKAIFGESSDEDDDTPVTAPAPKKVADDDDDDDDDLFGKSSDEDGDDDAPAKGEAGDAADEADEGDAEAQAEAAALPEAIEPFQAPIVDRPSKEMKVSSSRSHALRCTVFASLCSAARNAAAAAAAAGPAKTRTSFAATVVYTLLRVLTLTVALACPLLRRYRVNCPSPCTTVVSVPPSEDHRYRAPALRPQRV